MADFQAACELTITDCVISIQDTSDYAGNTDAGHAAANFTDYRKMLIKRPVDLDTYDMETTAANTSENDETIVAPSVTAGLTVDAPTSWNLLNGNYIGIIVSIPTWDAAITYTSASVDCVYRSGKLYKCVAVTSTGDVPNGAGAASWELFTLEDLLSAPASYSKYYGKINLEQSCITENTIAFEATFLDSTGATDISIDTDCDLVTFGDNSNYNTTDENGHDESCFTDYIKIIISKPDGTDYVLGSLTGDDVAIGVPSLGSHSYGWDMDDSDNDGLYNMKIVTFPTWKTDIYYNSFTASQPVIVYYDGLLWKALVANLNSIPAEGSTDWELYEGTGEGTRYCFQSKTVITCRTIDPCYVSAVDAYVNKRLCGNCPNDLCSNPCLLKMVDLNAIKDAIAINTCRKNWSMVEDLINLGLSTCSC